MHKPFILITFLFLFTFTSCSTLKDSISVGVLSGAIAGGVGGKKFSHTESDKKAKIAAASGAVLGGIASYFIHTSLQKRDAKVRKKTLFNLENFGVSKPNGSTEDSGDYFFSKQNFLREHKGGHHN